MTQLGSPDSPEAQDLAGVLLVYPHRDQAQGRGSCLAGCRPPKAVGGVRALLALAWEWYRPRLLNVQERRALTTDP